MRTVFLILLGLSFLSAVQAVPLKVLQENVTVPMQKKEKSETPRMSCDPKEKAKMPETFY